MRAEGIHTTGCPEGIVCDSAITISAMQLSARCLRHSLQWTRARFAVLRLHPPSRRGRLRLCFGGVPKGSSTCKIQQCYYWELGQSCTKTHTHIVYSVIMSEIYFFYIRLCLTLLTCIWTEWTITPVTYERLNEIDLKIFVALCSAFFYLHVCLFSKWHFVVWMKVNMKCVPQLRCMLISRYERLLIHSLIAWKLWLLRSELRYSALRGRVCSTSLIFTHSSCSLVFGAYNT
jgi:hypothetical protein